MAKRKRRHGGRRRHRIHARTNPKRRRFLRTRRNPRLLGLGTKGFISNAIMPAIIGAGGAIASDWALANIPIPQTWRTGTMVPLVRVGAAFLVGMAISAVTKNEELGEQATAGALIVTAYGMTRNWMQQNMPNVPLARYMPLNRYMNGRRRKLGFIRRPGVVRLGNNPAGAHKFREMRGGAQQIVSRGQLGYIGPARTLGRYVQNPRFGA